MLTTSFLVQAPGQRLNRSSAKGLMARLTAASRAPLESNHNRPKIYRLIEVSGHLGRKHSFAQISLLK
jgi:hypothetical protein